MSDAYYVVRLGFRRGLGSYLVADDGEKQTVSCAQRHAWRAPDLDAAECVAGGIGDARAVRVNPRKRTTHAKDNEGT